MVFLFQMSSFICTTTDLYCANIFQHILNNCLCKKLYKTVAYSLIFKDNMALLWNFKVGIWEQFGANLHLMGVEIKV